MKNTLKLAGHTFTLRHIQYGIHSEETIDFYADLFCDGQFLCSCENDGHGGSTFTHCRPETRDRYLKVLEEVGKVVWLTCKTGDIIYHNLGYRGGRTHCNEPPARRRLQVSERGPRVPESQ